MFTNCLIIIQLKFNIAVYTVLLSLVLQMVIYYYFRLVSAMFNMREHRCRYYWRRKTFKAITCRSHVRVS